MQTSENWMVSDIHNNIPYHKQSHIKHIYICIVQVGGGNTSPPMVIIHVKPFIHYNRITWKCTTIYIAISRVHWSDDMLLYHVIISMLV